MILALDEATIKTIGLLATFVGIGILVNVLLIYIAVQIHGERQQNQEYLKSQRSVDL